MEVRLDRKSFQSNANRYMANKFEHVGCCKLTSLERSLNIFKQIWGDPGQGVLIWVGGGAGSGAIGVLK